MDSSRCSSLVWALPMLLTWAGTAHGQASQDDVEALPMPPPASEIVWTHSLQNVQVNTGHERFTASDPWAYAVQGVSDSGDPRQLAYFRCTNVGGKIIRFTPRP